MHQFLALDRYYKIGGYISFGAVLVIVDIYRVFFLLGSIKVDTCISMMTEKEVSPTLIKKIVGHFGAMSLTEKGYTHVNVQERLEAINRI